MSKMSTPFRSVSYGPCSRTGVHPEVERSYSVNHPSIKGHTNLYEVTAFPSDKLNQV